MKENIKIKDLTFKEQSLLFARFSEHAYLPVDKAKPLFYELGFDCVFYTNKGSDVYVLYNSTDVVVVCRGTQPTQLSDIKADLRLALVTNESGVGEVHHGFQHSVNKVWNKIVSKIKSESALKDVYFTGHSLGAAMATIMTMRCTVDQTLKSPTSLFTYGSPRVGDLDFARFMQSLKVPHYRWVNNADIVTRLPSRPYKHHGELKYMSHEGDVVEMRHWQIIKDRIKGFFIGLSKFDINFFVNHSIERYVKNLEKWNS